MVHRVETVPLIPIDFTVEEILLGAHWQGQSIIGVQLFGHLLNYLPYVHDYDCFTKILQFHQVVTKGYNEKIASAKISMSRLPFCLVDGGYNKR
jgi:hypothetical protein